MALEVRMFSGKTLSNTTKSNSNKYISRKEIYSYLMDFNRDVVTNNRFYSRHGFLGDIKDRLARIVRSVSGKYETGEGRLTGPLASVSGPLRRALSVLFSKNTIWHGQPDLFYKTLVDVVLFTYHTARQQLGDSPEAEAVARSTSRIFCNFMLSTRITYEASKISDLDIMAAEEAAATTPLGSQAAAIEERELEEGPTGQDVKVMANKLKVIFTKLRMRQYIEINPMNLRFIAYAFIVNASNITEGVNIIWYGKGTRAYTEIIQLITDAAIAGVATEAYSRKRSYSEHEYTTEDEMSGIEDESVFMDDETFENDEVFDDDEEALEYAEYEEDYTEDEQEDEFIPVDEDYPVNEDYEDYEDTPYYNRLGSEDYVEPTEDYDYADETGIDLMKSEASDEEVVETLAAIEPSAKAYSMAKKFLMTRHFSNTLDFKRKFYEYLIDEFVGRRAYAKDEGLKEAIADLVDKVDVLADKLDDLPSAVASIIEGSDRLTKEEQTDEDDDEGFQNAGWEDFWKSGEDKIESDEEEATEEEEEGTSDESDEDTEEEEVEEKAESRRRYSEDEEEEREANFYARLRHYKKRAGANLRPKAMKRRVPKKLRRN